MTTPDYKTHDPKGWCGDPRRGAAMGRPSVHSHRFFSRRLYLRQVRLDSGGYDVNGTYFGQGDPLYWCASADNEIDFMLRAASRVDAVTEVTERYPYAKLKK